MKKFIIERNIPSLGNMTAQELHSIASSSNAVLDKMKAPYHWVQSFATNDTLYCVHIAPDEDTVREHARSGGFPADHIVEVTSIIDPTS